MLGHSTCDTQVRRLQVHVNPLVNWIWFGVGVIVHRHDHRAAAGARVRVAPAKVPEGADTTTMLLVAVPCRWAPRSLRAQHVGTSRRRSPSSRSRRSRRSCRTRSSACAARAAASASASARVRRRRRCATRSRSSSPQGKTRDEVIQYFVDEVRQPGSRSPSRSTAGFNRLAWLLPYGAGARGRRRRWAASRCGGRGERDADAPDGRRRRASSRDFEHRLDDELRDLD